MQPKPTAWTAAGSGVQATVAALGDVGAIQTGLWANRALRCTGRLSLTKQLPRVEVVTTINAASVEHRITVLTLQSITVRIRFLTAQLDDIDPELGRLLRQHPAGPALLAQQGVGPVVAARLLLSWSYPGWVRNESARPGADS